MRFYFLSLLMTLLASAINAPAQRKEASQLVNALELTMIGRPFPDAPPYHRLDTALVKGMNASQNQQARCSAGLALLFRTNSSYIDLIPSYRWKHRRDNMTGIASSGFDLYIKRGGQWIYAGTTIPSEGDSVTHLVWDMDTSTKECLLYLPLYSELSNLKIGIGQGAAISSVPNPFRYKMVIFGSSFTQGTSASRPGMSFPAQIGRELNIEVCNLGFAGNSKLQPYFAEAIASVEADALVFDAFSNPTDSLINERLESFVATIARKHRNTPIIFLHTLYRGRNNFNLKSRESEAAKRKAATELMESIMRRYPNIYLLENPLTGEVSDDMSADSVHPSDIGYQFIAKKLSAELRKLLKIRK